jgi:3-oxoacyl-[acyl-carrier-protein] synthase-3
MISDVYINKLGKYLPNTAVSNEDMEEYLGLIEGIKSRSKNIVLRNNGIKTRYYAIDKSGRSTHSNAELTVEAIKNLFDENFRKEDIELLACGTTTPDQLLPSHASMVHGILQCPAIDVISPGGSCNSGMLALKYGYMSIRSGLSKNAVCSGSEKLSTWMLSKNFEEEAKHLNDLGKNPYIAFEKEFLRWMLSDGAGAALLQDKPNKNGFSLKINWIEIKSYANELKTCMYAGAIKKQDGNLIPWRDIDSQELYKESIFSLKQDTRILEKNITKKGGEFLKEIADKYNITENDFDYFLPHISSEFFKKHLIEDAKNIGINISDEKWFTNLARVGNVGSASFFLMLEELFYSGKLKKGDRILVMVPESARFSYTYMMTTVQ